MNETSLPPKKTPPPTILPATTETLPLALTPQTRTWVPVVVASLGLMFFLVILGLHYFPWAAPNHSVSPNSSILFVTVTPTLPADTPRLGEENLAMTLATPTALPTPYFAEANEMGQVLVLMYHRITYPEARYQRTPENLRADIQRLYEGGYYPVNFIDLLQGFPHLPGGKKPVVITFDDSDMTQFNVMADNTIDADSALGILLNFHYEHSADWPLRATFFILADDRNDYFKIFGQPEFAQAKLKVLTDLGLEVASHTVTHADLSVTTAERIYWELAVSQHVLEELVPGYQVQTLAVPFGGFPYTVEFLKSGQWGQYHYAYLGNAAAWGGPSPSPFDPSFDSYRVPRLEVDDQFLTHWLDYFAAHPDKYYISDGDPNRLTYPRPLAETISQ